MWELVILRRLGVVTAMGASLGVMSCGSSSPKERACAGLDSASREAAEGVYLNGRGAGGQAVSDRQGLCRTFGRPDRVEAVKAGERWTYDRGGVQGVFVVARNGRVSGSGARFGTVGRARP